MGCNENCNSKACSCLNIVISIILGAAVGVLFAFRFIPNIFLAAKIAFGLGILTLIFLVIGVFLAGITSPNILSKCLCKNTTCLLVGTIGTIIASIAALSITLNPAWILVAILVGIGAFFVSLMIIALITLIKCIACKLCFHKCE